MKQITTIKNETTHMSLAVKLGLTESQLDLVKRTVAKNATPDELELFFYRCKELQLNPLMPGQVYFLKFGNSPGTVIVGLDGFRARAMRTGKHSGTKRGVIRNQEGQCIGGWADVYRKDWEHPAHVEVSLAEYADPRKQTWKTMPETMIQKVAEIAALRMAFPEELGGVYAKEEMDKADHSEVNVIHTETHQKTNLKPSVSQLGELVLLSEELGISNSEMKQIILKNYGHESSKDLSIDEFDDLYAKLKAKTIQVKKTESIEPDQLTPEAETEISEDSEISENLTSEVKSQELPWTKYLNDSDPRFVK